MMAHIQDVNHPAEEVALVDQARESVCKWKTAAQQAADELLEHAYTCIHQAITIIDEKKASSGQAEELGSSPLVYMELAALAFRTCRYQEMAHVCHYIISSQFPDSDYTGMAMHAAALLHCLSSRHMEALKCYAILLVKMPKVLYPPTSYLDFLPQLPYAYSYTLEMTLIYEQSGQTEMSEQGLHVIHERLRRKIFEISQQPEGLREPWPNSYEPFDDRIKAMSLETWIRSTLVWKRRLLAYLKVENWLVAAMLAHKVAKLLIEEYPDAYAYRQLRRRQIAEILLTEAECYGKLKLMDRAFAPAKLALEWVPDDPVYLTKSLPYIDAVFPDPKLTEEAQKQQDSSKILQQKARQHIINKTRDAKALRSVQAATLIQKRWRAWDTWNEAATTRLQFYSPTNVNRLLQEYEHARPAQKAAIMQAKANAELAIATINSVLRMLIARRRLQLVKRAATMLQRIYRGTNTRKRLRAHYEGESGYLPGRRSLQIMRHDLPDDSFYSLNRLEQPKETARVEIGIFSRQKTKTGEEKEDAVVSRQEEQWLPLCIAADSRVLAMFSGATAAVLKAKCMNSWDMLRLNRFLLQQSVTQSLTTVLIYGTNIGSIGLKALATFMDSDHCRVTTLGLGDNRMGHRDEATHQGLRALARSFRSPASILRRFYLESDPTLNGNLCAEIILPEVQRSKTLTHVALRGLGLTDDIIYIITNTILIRPDLSTLDVEHNHLSCEGVESLLQGLWDRMTASEEETLQVQIRVQHQYPPLPRERLQKLAYRLVEHGHHHTLFQVISSPNGGISEIELIGKHVLAPFAVQDKIDDIVQTKDEVLHEPPAQAEAKPVIRSKSTVKPDSKGDCKHQTKQTMVHCPSRLPVMKTRRRSDIVARATSIANAPPTKQCVAELLDNKKSYEKGTSNATKSIEINNKDIIETSIDPDLHSQGTPRRRLKKEFEEKRKIIDDQEHVELTVKNKILF